MDLITLSPNKIKILAIAGLALLTSIIDTHYELPGITIPTTLSQLQNKTAPSKISFGVIIKFILLIVAWFLFKDEYRFLIMVTIGIELIEEFFELNESKFAMRGKLEKFNMFIG